MLVVLAYFISTPSESPEIGCKEPTRIFIGTRFTEEGDEEHLGRFSDVFDNTSLASVSCTKPPAHAETTFDPLRKNLPFKWYDDEKFDTANPFGDSRQIQYHALWTFDTQRCTLRLTNAKGRWQIPFARLRKRPVSLDDMQLLGGPVPVLPEPVLDKSISYWKPQIVVDGRVRAFTHRLLRDFHHQWRHILRNEYNSVTSRKLARAIIRLSTLDFEVRENTGGHGRRGVHVWIMQLLAWESFETNILRVGNLWIVLCEDILKGLSMAQHHSASPEFIRTQNSSTTKPEEPQAHYMIMSVKYVMLCHATGPSALLYTSPERLFNGDYNTRPLSPLALDYLVWATSVARPSVDSPFQRLPIELQDMILSYVSVGTVAAAKLGCILGLGSPFSWKDGPFRVSLEERYTIRPSRSPVESEIWFGEHKSGIVYLVRADKTQRANVPVFLD